MEVSYVCIILLVITAATLVWYVKGRWCSNIQENYTNTNANANTLMVQIGNQCLNNNMRFVNCNSSDVNQHFEYNTWTGTLQNRATKKCINPKTYTVGDCDLFNPSEAFMNLNYTDSNLRDPDNGCLSNVDGVARRAACGSSNNKVELLNVVPLSGDTRDGCRTEDEKKACREKMKAYAYFGGNLLNSNGLVECKSCPAKRLVVKKNVQNPANVDFVELSTSNSGPQRFFSSTDLFQSPNFKI